LIVTLRRNYNPAMVPASAETNRLHALLASLRDFVLRTKRSLDDDIRSYPTPIPRCDAQFNHAYEQRASLAALLQRIDAAAADNVRANALLRAMAEFSALPPIGESDEERILRARIADALAGAGVAIVASRSAARST
jgi:hypothetical protein